MHLQGNWIGPPLGTLPAADDVRVRSSLTVTDGEADYYAGRSVNWCGLHFVVMPFYPFMPGGIK